MVVVALGIIAILVYSIKYILRVISLKNEKQRGIVIKERKYRKASDTSSLEYHS